jgi:hypothetical protein
MPFWAVGWWRVRVWRCKQAGLDNLEWQRNLKCDDEWTNKEDPNYGKPTQQAIGAQEILDLYTWWTEERPKRPDPYDASGWTALCERRRQSGKDFFDFEDRTEEEKAESAKVLDLCHEIEEKYDREDEEMMIRLIKIRKGLWT